MVFSNSRCLFVVFIILFISGCSSIGKIENEPLTQLPEGKNRYTVSNYLEQHPVGDTLFVMAFSGGGTRAAALSYGVLEELRDTHYQVDGKEVRLLDDVDRISSVSGGSFTSAYYGLFGDQIFDNFKDEFLYKDVQGDLSSLLMGVFDLIGRMFTTSSRTEVAIDYYDKNIFKGKTFADFQRSGGPMIIINATDLNSYSPFIFLQAQFDFLCSDLSEFKVARAVAASSAVPILFPPILIERHDDCHYQKPEWLSRAENKAERESNLRLKESVSALNFYLDKDNPPYVTLLDGGVTDNLGLRTILKTVNFTGGAKKAFDKVSQIQKPPKRLVVIVVDASTTSETDIGKSTTLPSIGDTLAAVTDIQLHLYNTETNTLLKEKLKQWSKKISTEEHPVTPYFIDLNVTSIEEQADRLFFNRVPTSFSIEKSQADKLIELSKQMLRQNPEYQKLLQQLGASNKN
ncbi:MAG: patatin-like phospholipase family protein [Gammaproteobacteria bacterium]|nr:patatin-like phospholipase family protein [Gammaproteobacteria bacterium]